MRRFTVDRAALAGLSSEERAQAEADLAVLEQAQRENPLLFFEPHSVEQREFLEAGSKVVAAFAGNRFGKTTSLVVRALRENLPPSLLNPWMRRFKRFGVDEPAHGWILCPTEEKIYDSLHPALKKWTPGVALRGGSWAKAWNGERMQLSFARGDTISFKTYKQDPSTLGGAALHWVGYDEPPPREHRDECATRLIDYGGFEMYAMTPLKANTGWIRRDIFKKREAPHITVVQGSMHDNPFLDPETKRLILDSYASDIWRRAREFGDFVNVGGLVYAEFGQCVVDRFDPAFVRGLDNVVSIDPGIRNCGIVFGGFDDENAGFVWDELLLQDATVEEYARRIGEVLGTWGLSVGDVMFVIDPAARSRGQVNAESVESALARLGIFCDHGQNQVEAGVQQIRGRLAHRRLSVGRNCVLLRDEADEYAAEDRDDGEFRPIKENDHVLDALRYWAMTRPWFAEVEAEAPNRRLGQVVQGVAQPWDGSSSVADAGPMGAFA